MITDLYNILKTVIYAPPPLTPGIFEPKWVSVRKQKIEQLWLDIKKPTH